MIQLAGRLHNLRSAESSASIGNRRVEPKSQSFAAELEGELGKIGKSVEPGRLPATLAPDQQSVTWRDTGGTINATSGAVSEPSGLNGLVISYPTATATGAKAAVTSPVSFDDAYWSKQPAAVQQLRNVQDPTQRTQLATQLAHEGYSIDVPIMAWGWDPAITTQARQSMGYTWVPSALQKPVEVAPGLSLPGQTSYDSAHAPAGSIAV
jgi:hypothetical protein